MGAIRSWGAPGLGCKVGVFGVAGRRLGQLSPTMASLAARVALSAAEVVTSWRDGCPSGHRGAQFEHGEAGEILCSGEEAEVGVDLASAAHASSSSAVPASHHVAELALDLGAGRSVVVSPIGVSVYFGGVTSSPYPLSR